MKIITTFFVALFVLSCSKTINELESEIPEVTVVDSTSSTEIRSDSLWILCQYGMKYCEYIYEGYGTTKFDDERFAHDHSTDCSKYREFIGAEHRLDMELRNSDVVNPYYTHHELVWDFLTSQ